MILNKIAIPALFMLLLMPMVFAAVSGPSPVPTPPNFYITTSATYLCKGQTNLIPITVTNAGTPGSLNEGTSLGGAAMQDVAVSITNSKALYPGSASTATVESIASNSSATLRIPVFVLANASSIIPTTVSINYYYLTYYTDSEVRNLTFSAQECPQQLNATISPSSFSTGVTQPISISLENNGTTPINSTLVRVSIPNVDGTMISTQPIEVPQIAPQSTYKLNESIFISTNATESVPLNLSVIYYNGTTLYQLYKSVGIPATGIIQITPSSFTASPTIPSAGSIFSVSFVMTNTGTASATATTVTALPPPGFTVFGSPSSFVGELSVDSQTPVTLSLTTNKTLRSGTYEIPIRINYLNNLRQNITTWANTSVRIGAPVAFNSTAVTKYRSSSSGSGLLLLILIVAIIVLGYLYYRERKKRPKDKAH